MQTRTLLLAQFFISTLMALLMTGLFSFVELGLTQIWAQVWLEHFLTAWPIAFILSLVVSNLSFWMATRLTA